MQSVQSRLDTLTKPQGSLGRLEQLVVQLAGIQGTSHPAAAPAAVAIMAADHGVAAAGVSAYPQDVTAQMVYNFLRDGAAINVLARCTRAQVYVANIGVKGDLMVAPGKSEYLDLKVCNGTANMTERPAMTREQAIAAMAAGARVAVKAVGDGANVLVAGEMGIGNTTSAAALLCAFTGCAPQEVTGRGTGVDMAGWRRKVAAIEQALTVNAPDKQDPLGVLAKVGGLEIAAISGFILQGAALHRPVVLDGFISTAGALAAVHLCPEAAAYLVPSHLSQEPGHKAMLAALRLEPMLYLDMRLGEGTGAMLVLPLLEASVHLLQEMATFSEAGVSGREL